MYPNAFNSSPPSVAYASVNWVSFAYPQPNHALQSNTCHTPELIMRTKKALKLFITGPLWGESSSDQGPNSI